MLSAYECERDIFLFAFVFLTIADLGDGERNHRVEKERFATTASGQVYQRAERKHLDDQRERTSERWGFIG